MDKCGKTLGRNKSLILKVYDTHTKKCLKLKKNILAKATLVLSFTIFYFFLQLQILIVLIILFEPD